MKEICIKVIEKSEMRYDTIGDYWVDDKGVVQFRIANMHNTLYHMLIIVHELIEWTLCTIQGISVAEVDRWDYQFEKDRAAGKHSKTAEPGDHPKCPYRHHHQFATKIEMLVAKAFGVNWKFYNKTVETT